MSGQEHQEELKRFEAELASLTPRAGGLDPHWRSLLAREAALTAETVAKRAVCPCCGRAAPRGLKRWAWPGAFSAMSAIAAALLAVVIARPAPRPAEVVIAPAPVRPSQVQHKSPAVPMQQPDRPTVGWVSRPDLTGDVGWTSRPDQAGLGEPSYLWQSPPLPSGPEPDVATVPLTSRELLEQLLKDPLAGGEARAAAGLEPAKSRGAKS